MSHAFFAVAEVSPWPHALAGRGDASSLQLLLRLLGWDPSLAVGCAGWWTFLLLSGVLEDALAVKVALGAAGGVREAGAEQGLLRWLGNIGVVTGAGGAMPSVGEGCVAEGRKTDGGGGGGGGRFAVAVVPALAWALLGLCRVGLLSPPGNEELPCDGPGDGLLAYDGMSSSAEYRRPKIFAEDGLRRGPVEAGGFALELGGRRGAGSGEAEELDASDASGSAAVGALRRRELVKERVRMSVRWHAQLWPQAQTCAEWKVGQEQPGTSHA